MPAGASRDDVVAALEACGWIRAAAARALGMSRQALYKAMARLQISARDPRPEVLGAARARGPRGLGPVA